MINENDFDQVHDCQEIFRHILYAISNPGEVECISEQARKIKDENAVMLTIALTLLDKETSFWVADDECLAREISQLTYAKNVGQQQANFIFVSKQANQKNLEQMISCGFPGSLVEPHTSTTFVVAVDSLEKAPTCILTGPGIQKAKNIGLNEYAKMWIQQRDLLTYEYPMGVDIFFVTKAGKIMAVPRKVKMEG